MTRPQKERTVEKLPSITHFKPAGVPLHSMEEIILTIEEMEAMRLSDIEQLDQASAAERMSISSPTFNRLLNKAHQKVASALWNGKALKIEGGCFRIHCEQHSYGRMLGCKSCGNKWNVPHGMGRCRQHLKCPACSSEHIIKID